MTNDERLALPGTVLAAVADAKFRVRIDGGQVLLVELAAALRDEGRRILAGDRVTVELTPIDGRSVAGPDGHIIYRP